MEGRGDGSAGEGERGRETLSERPWMPSGFCVSVETCSLTLVYVREKQRESDGFRVQEEGSIDKAPAA